MLRPRHRPMASITGLARTAVFFLKVLPMLPSRLIDWLTPNPIIEDVCYPTATGQTQGQLYRPDSRGPHLGVVVCLGVVPFGVDHPQVPRLGEALARAGFASLLYWSPAMRDLRLAPEDVEGIARAYRWMIDLPTVDAARSGLIGTCVGGSFALMAAAHPLIRDRVNFVTAWAPYASMRTLGCDIASGSTLVGAERQPWEVDQLTRKVYVRSLTAVLDVNEAEILRDACAERESLLEPDTLSERGRLVYPLLTSLDVPSAQAALEQLPPDMQQRLDAMSPIDYVNDLHTPLIVLAHDCDDQVIPIGESRRLREALAAHAGLRYTEFTMFKHLDPTKVSMSGLSLARELVRFFLSVYPIFRQSAARSPDRVHHEPPSGLPHTTSTSSG